MHWTTQDSPFDGGPMRTVRRQGYPHVGGQPRDHPYRTRRHFLADGCTGSLNGETVFLRVNSKDREHARTECCAHQVRWRKQRSFAAVIHRSIRTKNAFRRAVRRLCLQPTNINNFNAYHASHQIPYETLLEAVFERFITLVLPALTRRLHPVSLPKPSVYIYRRRVPGSIPFPCRGAPPWKRHPA